MNGKSAATLCLVTAFLLPASSLADGERTLHGLYTSGYQDGHRRLEAVFTPSGENRWDVVFHFNFNGRDYEYKGTASGSLEEGALEGRVENETRSRTFTFKGEVRKGEFRGSHAEVLRDREERTGTLRMRG